MPNINRRGARQVARPQQMTAKAGFAGFGIFPAHGGGCSFQVRTNRYSPWHVDVGKAGDEFEFQAADPAFEASGAAGSWYSTRTSPWKMSQAGKSPVHASEYYLINLATGGV
jgi:hypothetical protein